MNANSFWVKQGQGLKNYHSNFPLIAPSDLLPWDRHLSKRNAPSTAPNGVLIEAGFPIGFSGSGMSLMKLGIWGPGPTPGSTSFQEERPEYSSQRCLTRGSPIGFLGSGMSLMKLGIRDFLAKRGGIRDWNYTREVMQLNLSTPATLGSEESGRCFEVTISEGSATVRPK